MAKYRKKPVVIEAYVFNPPTAEGGPKWSVNWEENEFPGVRPTSYLEVGKALNTSGCSKEHPYWGWEVMGAIESLEGPMFASPGDYIITGVNGEQYPCKPDIFEKTYEKVV